MKYLILEVAGSTQPLYLHIDKIVSFTARNNATAVKLDNGVEVLTPVPAALLHERIEHLLQHDKTVDRTASAVAHLQATMERLPDHLVSNLWNFKVANRGWLPRLLHKFEVL